MWTESTMPFGQSLIVSALGISVVFLTLVVLACSIMVISKILGAILGNAGSKKAAPVAAPVAPAAPSEADQELLAVLMSVIAEDLGLPTEQFRILNVTEIK